MIAELGRLARGLLHTPLSTTAIVSTLALGIGTTTAVFSIVDGVLLEPLPFRDPDGVVMLWQRAPGVGVTEDWFSPAQYFDIRERVRTLQAAAIVYGMEITLAGEGTEPERVGALGVSSSWFQVLGVTPTLGRALGPDDDVPGSPRKVLLADGMFRRRFGADAAVIGSTIRYDGADAEVIGVLPPDLVLDANLFPTLQTVALFELVVAMPMEDPGVTTRGSENFNVIGRLAPGATDAVLAGELLDLADHFRQDPGSLAAGLDPGSGFRLDAVRISDQMVGPTRLPLVVLLAATLAMLIVACANVANLLLTRANVQRHELGIRAALGARSGDLLRQALLQSAMLALAAGAGGLAVSWFAVSALHAAAPPELPRLRDVGLSPTVLSFTAGLCLLATLAFGAVPAFRAARVAPGDAMRSTATAVRARSAWRNRGTLLLVAAQVAISLVLVAGALLLGRAFWQLRTLNPGFDPAGALTWRIAMSGEPYVDPAERSRFVRRLREALQGLDATVAAGGVSMLPFTRGYAWTDFRVEGREVVDARDRIVADLHVATPGYFEALGATVLAGRSFTDADGTEGPVVMVNRAFAERFWATSEAVGKWTGRDSLDEKATIVGVVETVRHYGLGAETRPAVYYPHTTFPTRNLYGVLRVHTGDPRSFAGTVTRLMQELDPELPVYDVRTMGSRISDSLARERLLMTLVGLFGTVALVVASIGLYGVLAAAVASHTHEIGIRKSLGARTPHLYRLVLGGAFLTVLGGIVLGLVVVVAAGGMATGLLHGVPPTDPLALTGALVLVAAVALVAGLVPARRAAAVDPMVALRSE